MSSLYKYYQQSVDKWTTEDIEALIRAGFIDANSLNSRGSVTPDNLKLTPLFLEAIFLGEKDFEEFWSTYPGFVDNFQDARGPKVILKAVDKDEIEELYKKRIRTQIAHEILMRSLRWGIKKNMINMRIDNFLKSEIWKELDQLRIKEGVVADSLPSSGL